MRTITTRLTPLLGDIHTPIVSAPMATAASPAMAAAVTRAGGFGFIGTGMDTAQQLQASLTSLRAALGVPPGAPVPAGIGFLGCVLDMTEPSADPRLPAVLAQQPWAIWLAFGADLGKYVTQVRAYDATREHRTVVFVLVNSVAEARRAAHEWGADVLVVQGNEAGGHGGAYAPPLLTLLQAVLDAVPSGPAILAAGGISTGAQAAALLALGADGVVLGSRLLCTPECVYPEAFKAEILSAGMSATARSRAFDEVSRMRFWPADVDGRAIANAVLGDYGEGLEVGERVRRYDEAKERGERGRMVVWAGVGIGFVNDRRDAATIVREVHEDMVRTLEAIPRRVVGLKM